MEEFLFTAFSANARELFVEVVVVAVGAGLMGAKLALVTIVAGASTVAGSRLIVGYVPEDKTRKS